MAHVQAKTVGAALCGRPGGQGALCPGGQGALMAHLQTGQQGAHIGTPLQ
jgi:hypothetical protein